ncbi:MAG: hypothetical protein ABFS17_12110 [Chloroflexota bacterium]
MSLTTLKQRIGFVPKMTHIFVAAQFAFVVGLLLPRLAPQLPIVDFLTGMLIGFSIVGNIATLIKFGKEQSKKGDHHG